MHRWSNTEYFFQLLILMKVIWYIEKYFYGGCINNSLQIHMDKREYCLLGIFVLYHVFLK